MRYRTRKIDKQIITIKEPQKDVIWVNPLDWKARRYING